MHITYKELSEGHILQEGDTVDIHTFRGIIVRRDGRGYYLNDPQHENGAVYGLLKGESRIAFPEKDSLYDLKQEILCLIQMSPFKEGDTVVIKERIGENRRDYPFSFVDDMAKLVGHVFKITEIFNIASDSPQRNCKYFNGDYHKYYLDGNAKGFVWHSSMFEKVESSFVKDVGDPIISSKETNGLFIPASSQGITIIL